MIRPLRSEIEEFADQTYGIAIEHLLAQNHEKRHQAICQASRTGNRGAFLPALSKVASEQVGTIIRARTGAYLEAFSCCGVPPDIQAEIDLGKFAMQVMGGAISGLRGDLALQSQRTRQPSDPDLSLCHFEIGKSGHSALREGILRLRRQQTLCRLQTPVSARASGGSPQVGSISDRKKKRGRPQTIPEARKTRAMELKALGATNKQLAAELYGTKYPTDRQRRNVPTILRYHQRRSERASTPNHTRKTDPPPARS